MYDDYDDYEDDIAREEYYEELRLQAEADAYDEMMEEMDEKERQMEEDEDAEFEASMYGPEDDDCWDDDEPAYPFDEE